jgi:hypothetical protein
MTRSTTNRRRGLPGRCASQVVGRERRAEQVGKVGLGCGIAGQKNKSTEPCARAAVQAPTIISAYALREPSSVRCLTLELAKIPRLTSAASSWRMPPSLPRASRHSHASVFDLHGARRPASTSMTPRRVCLENSSDPDAISKYVEIVFIPLARGPAR